MDLVITGVSKRYGRDVLGLRDFSLALAPEERVRFRNLLSDLSGERIVILSTHIVADMEAVATDIAIIVHGRLVRHAAVLGVLLR
jgi:ABC-type thiamine transport system ATPase subunit